MSDVSLVHLTSTYLFRLSPLSRDELKSRKYTVHIVDARKAPIDVYPFDPQVVIEPQNS